MSHGCRWGRICGSGSPIALRKFRRTVGSATVKSKSRLASPFIVAPRLPMERELPARMHETAVIDRIKTITDVDDEKAKHLAPVTTRWCVSPGCASTYRQCCSTKASLTSAISSWRPCTIRACSPADGSAAEFQECFVNVRSTIEAYAKTTEVAEPRMSPFNDPLNFPRPLPCSVRRLAITKHGGKANASAFNCWSVMSA